MSECKKQNRNKNKPCGKAYTAGRYWERNKAISIIRTFERAERDGKPRCPSANAKLKTLPATAVLDACQKIGRRDLFKKYAA